MLLSINETLRAVPLGKASQDAQYLPESLVGTPVLRLDEVATARVRLASGQVVRVMELSSGNFYGWLAWRLTHIYPRRWPADAQLLMSEYAGQTLDLYDRWYLLDEICHLPKIRKLKLEIIVQDELAHSA